MASSDIMPFQHGISLQGICKIGKGFAKLASSQIRPFQIVFLVLRVGQLVLFVNTVRKQSKISVQRLLAS